jgi:hypothetical protein
MKTNRSDPNQLKMFMTPKEIVNNYQVLDGDREDYWGESARAGSITARPYTTAGVSNGRWLGGTGTPSYRRPYPIESDEQVLSRKSMEAQMDPDDYAEYRGDEPSHFDYEGAANRSSAPQAPSTASTSRWDSFQMKHDSYMDRKVDEYERGHIEKRSIWDSVRLEGVHSPVTLSTEHVGSQGKQQIAGGHHRLAAALDTRPNDYLPVVHARNVDAAKSDPHQPYT